MAVHGTRLLRHAGQLFMFEYSESLGLLLCLSSDRLLVVAIKP